MRITLFLFFTALTFISCINFDRNNVDTEQPTGAIDNGKKQGEWKTYYTNGRIAKIENYQNDTLHGEILYYDDKGKLNGKGFYKMGVRVDSSHMYFPNGKAKLEEWKDSSGKTQGLFKVYYQNGQPSQIGYMKDNYLDDTCNTFFKNGQLKVVEFYKEKKKEGVWQYFSNEGKLIRTEQYSNDKLVSSTE